MERIADHRRLNGDVRAASAVALDYRELESPVGPLHLVASRAGLCALAFDDRWDGARAPLARRFGSLRLVAGSMADIAGRLRAYFEGEVDALADIPVDVEGTPFQRRVWEALRNIPAGATQSYAELARAIGSPRAVRAVGAANGANPVAIVIPCHRVIAAGGGLGGYSGGLWRKRRLLAHEA